MLDKNIPYFIRHPQDQHPAAFNQKLDSFVKFLGYKDD